MVVHEKYIKTYACRWPQGESYIDVKKRIQKVVFELERQRNHVVVISHRTGRSSCTSTSAWYSRMIFLLVLRCLYSYFMDVDPKDTPYVNFPLHHVVVLRPNLIGKHTLTADRTFQMTY